MDKYKTLIDNTAIFMISRVGTKLIVFFLVPLYTICLTKAEYGTAELVVTTVDVAIPILTLGMHNAVFRFAMDKKLSGKDVLKCYYFVFCIACAAAIIVSAVLLQINSLKVFGQWFFPLFILTAFNDTYGLFLKAKNRTLIFAIDGLVYIAVVAILNIILLKYYDLGVLGYLLSLVVAKAVSIAYMFIFGKQDKIVIPKKINSVLLKDMIKYAGPLIANALSWWTINYADHYMLGIQVSMAVVGVYTIASKIPSMITTFNLVVMDAWVISYINEFEEGNPSDYFSKVFNAYNAVIMLLLSAVLLVLYPFMHIYVTARYYDAIPVIPLLLFGALFLAYSSFVGVVFGAEKKSMVFMTSSIIAAVLNIGLNLILIPIWGMYGAAIATLIAYIAMTVYRFIKAFKFIEIKITTTMWLSLLLLVIQTACVSLDWHQYIVSATVIILLIVLNLKVMKKTSKIIIKIMKKYLKRQEKNKLT